MALLPLVVVVLLHACLLSLMVPVTNAENAQVPWDSFENTPAETKAEHDALRREASVVARHKAAGERRWRRGHGADGGGGGGWRPLQRTNGGGGSAFYANHMRGTGADRDSLRFRRIRAKTEQKGGGGQQRRFGGLKSTFSMGKPSKKSMGDKEACVACEFIWGAIAQRVDKSTALVDDVGAAFEQQCQDAPDVFYEGCDFMYDQVGDMIQDFLAGTSASSACKNGGLCW